MSRYGYSTPLIRYGYSVFFLSHFGRIIRNIRICNVLVKVYYIWTVVTYTYSTYTY